MRTYIFVAKMINNKNLTFAFQQTKYFLSEITSEIPIKVYFIIDTCKYSICIRTIKSFKSE